MHDMLSTAPCYDQPAGLLVQYLNRRSGLLKWTRKDWTLRKGGWYSQRWVSGNHKSCAGKACANTLPIIYLNCRSCCVGIDLNKKTKCETIVCNADLPPLLPECQ